MNRTSPLFTGVATLSATTLAPYVEWAINGFPKPIPDGTAALVASGLIMFGHAAYNYLMARTDAKAAPKAP